MVDRKEGEEENVPVNVRLRTTASGQKRISFHAEDGSIRVVVQLDPERYPPVVAAEFVRALAAYIEKQCGRPAKVEVQA